MPFLPFLSSYASSVRNGYESITGQIDIEYLKPEDEQGVTLNLFTNTRSRMEVNADANDSFDMFDIITWTAHPIIVSFSTPWGPIALRWYALMFIIGFFIGVKLMEKYYKLDGKNPERVYTLFLYCFFGTLIGARLGHCLFYDPQYYLSHPQEILMTWKGGLASHGGTLGVFLAVLIYAKKDKST